MRPSHEVYYRLIDRKDAKARELISYVYNQRYKILMEGDFNVRNAARFSRVGAIRRYFLSGR